MPNDIDELGAMLADGWEVCGYNTLLFAAGAMSHNILLRKENSLATFTILKNGAKELGRSVEVHTPWEPAPPKKGIFG